MAFLPGYEHDVFVSYSRDDPKGIGASDLLRWTHAFIDRLKRRAGTGRPEFDGLSIWHDEALDRTDGLTDALKRTVERSAILMVVMSPRYLTSPWCTSERTWFEEQIALKRDRQGPVFVIRAMPTDETRWPSFLLDSAGHARPGFWFYPRGEPAPVPFGCPSPSDTDAAFNEALASVTTTLIQHLRRLHELAPPAVIGPATVPPAIPGITLPYVGLRPFEAEDAALYVGREKQIEEVVGRLKERRLVFMHASSGAGKSSLVRAGVLPALMRTPAKDGKAWRTATMRPSGGPLSNLAQALSTLSMDAGGVDATELVRWRLDADKVQLADIVDELQGLAGHPACLLVDQFEELFAQAREAGPEEAQRLVELLVGVARTPPGEAGLHIIVTMRSEFLGECARFDGLAEAINDAQYLLPRLADADLARAIMLPAQSAKGAVAPALAARLIADARGEQDELPLVQHGLMMMWSEARQASGARPPTLDLDRYKPVGPLARMLSRHADDAMTAAAADDARRYLVEELFRALIDVNVDGQAVRRRQTFRRLLDVTGTTGEPDTLRTIIDAFRTRDRAFLMPLAPTPIEPDTIIDIGHEALLRCWDSIRDPDAGWLKREFDDGLMWRSLLVQARSFDADHTSTLSETTTEERDAWLTQRNAAWAERYGGGWDRVEALMVASRQARDASRALRERAQAAELNAFRTQSLLLARLARTQLAEGLPVRAVQLALQGSPSPQSPRPSVPECNGVLAEALARQRELVALRGHESAVQSAVFSPDGQRLLTASYDSTARLWDAASGHELAVLRGHESVVRSAVFSPDGQRLLTASDDSTARLWDATSARELAALRGHQGGVLSAVFSPDGQRLLTASSDSTVRLWDAASGRALAVLRGHEGWVQNAVFSPDGQHLLTVSDDSTARLWDAASGRERAVLLGHGGVVGNAMFSPDGRRLLTASSDNTARLWDAASGHELAVLLGHEGAIRSAVFSPDGQRLLTASSDRTARLWDAASGRELAVLRGHEGAVQSAVFSPDGQRLLTASSDSTARLWATASGRELAVLRGHESTVLSAVFSPDGQRLLTASIDSTARLWDAASGRERTVLHGHEGLVGSAVFSSDGQRLLTASYDRTARLWDAASGRALAVLSGHQGGVLSAAFSPDGQRLLTASDDRTARLWDAASGRELAVPLGHEREVMSAVFSPDGQRLLTASYDRTARLWDAASGHELVILRGHESVVWSAVFSPDGQRLLTASDDNNARLWDATSGRELAVLRGHRDGVLSAVFSPDGQRLLTASDDSTARLWDAASGRELAVLRGHEGWVQSAVFSPDDQRLLTASYDRTARLWDATSGRELAVLRGHEDWVRSAVFSPDGKRLLTASDDGTVRIWRHDSTLETILDLSGYRIIGMDAIDHGQSIRFVLEKDNEILIDRIWIGDSVDALIETARARLPRELSDAERRRFYLPEVERSDPTSADDPAE